MAVKILYILGVVLLIFIIEKLIPRSKDDNLKDGSTPKEASSRYETPRDRANWCREDFLLEKQRREREEKGK